MSEFHRIEDLPLFLAAFVSFIGGLISFSRMRARNSHLSLLFLIALTFVVCGIAFRSDKSVLWAALGGLAFAVVLQVASIGMTYLLRRLVDLTKPPLTPERLEYIRRLFFTWMTILYGGAMSGTLLYLAWSNGNLDARLFVTTLLVCGAGGYFFAWFMWQFEAAVLKKVERHHKTDGAQDVV